MQTHAEPNALDSTQGALPRPPTGRIHAALKRATDAQHRALDGLPLLRALAEGKVGEEAYRHYIASSLALQQGLDQAVDSLLPPQMRARSRRRLVWLLADAAALKLPPRELPAGLLAPLRQVLADSTAAAWGVLYVQEGASLGAQMMLRANTNNPVVRTACHSLAGSGAATGALWRAFLAALETARPDTAQVVQGASMTFDLHLHVFES
jgi:heme oxygenase